MTTQPSSHRPNRREFLHYFVGGGTAAIAFGWLWPAVKDARAIAQNVDLEDFCFTYPQNSQCDDFLPGVAAIDEAGNAYEAEATLAQATAGDRLLAQGLDKPTYLVISEGPEIAAYAVSTVCTHLRCTVSWDDTAREFVCPCHGSRYDALGQVSRGPARQDLALVTTAIKDNQVRLVDREPEENPRT